jgi:cytochrome d ubiquinol oxidase subunit II
VLSLEIWVAASIIIALNLYMLMGGADYGGGVWDLFATGPRARQQRDLIAHAIGPIWEANHVWLILAITVLFTAFPAAFSAIATFLHVPLLILLIGIVFRGSAFAFRSFDSSDNRAQARWGVVFSISSLVTPVLLGITLGSIASGRIPRTSVEFSETYIEPWVAPFPIAVGFFALALFAFLAAVYLTVEADDAELREDFRRRSLVSWGAVALMALLVLVLSEVGAPELRQRMMESSWTLPLQLSTALAAVVAGLALWFRRFHLARLAVIVQSSLILWGWALAQFPNLIMPDLSIQATAAPFATLRLVFIALIAGGALLLPSFLYLLATFKSQGSRSDV